MQPLNELTDFARSLQFSDLPIEVAGTASVVLADTLGCIVGGSTTDIAKAVYEPFLRCAASGASTLFGALNKVDVVSAAHYHSVLSDALDFEDTLLAHPSAAVVPTALAVGEQVGATGQDVLTSVVVGYEVGSRIARAVMPTAEVERSRPVRYAWLGVAAAATAAKLLRLDHDRYCNAIAYAAASSPIPLWISKLPRPLHYLKNNFGEQTRVGVWGALVAESGFVSPRGLFNEPFGYAQMLGSDRFVASELSEALGESFQISATTFKPYPACRYIHSTLDAIAEIDRAAPVDWREVAAIHVVGFSEMTAWFADYSPSTIVDAQFSVPYAVAVMLMGVPIGPSWYAPETFQSQSLRALASRVTLESTHEHDALFSDQRIYRSDVSITLKSGRVLESTCSVPRGDTRRPLTEAELRSKYVTQMLSAGVKEQVASSTWDMCRRTHEMSSLHSLLEPLREEVGSSVSRRESPV